MTKTTKTLINKMHWPVKLKKVIEYSNVTSLLSKSQSLMLVVLTIKANNENSQQLIPLAVIGRVKEKRNCEKVSAISHSISLSPSLWVIIFIIIWVKIFFSPGKP